MRQVMQLSRLRKSKEGGKEKITLSDLGKGVKIIGHPTLDSKVGGSRCFKEEEES
jgi:hypothetical protein